MGIHRIGRYLLPTTDTIVGGLSPAGGRAPFGWRSAGPEGPARRAISDPEQPWLRSVLADLGAIATLEEDWDGRGAGPVPSDVLWYGLCLLQSVMEDFPAPQVTPTADGGLLLAWLQEGLQLRIEIEAAGAARVSYADARRGTSRSWQVKADFASLAEPLQAIAGSAGTPGDAAGSVTAARGVPDPAS